MTLDQMRTRFYELIEEVSTNTQFPSATVTAWINVAINLMNMEALYNETALSLSTVSGTRTVALPAGFIVTKDVYYTTAGGIKKALAPVRSEVIQYDFTTTGTPEFYSIRSGSLILDPIPDQSASSISGYYIGKETALSGDSDTPSMSDEFHMYIVRYAVYLACLADGQLEEGRPHLEEFLEGCRRLTMRSYDDKVRRNFNLFASWAYPGLPSMPPQQPQQG